MGKNKIGQFFSQASENAQISKSSKITNHSVRKTCIKTLLDSGISHNTVTQLSSHKTQRVLIVTMYAVASHDQQRNMSKILSGKTTSSNAARSTTLRRKPSKVMSSLVPVCVNSTTQQSQQTQALFAGANISVTNISGWFSLVQENPRA